ncbi:hypothetical protein BRE01_31600 [Brevibacillus reuszeri]|uniref:Uncharacterized protein n=1 Tax=Brevibacillus reuszeri TaxID=54915 RepID=A0A0K9YYH3_9BACL|nr:hypothetical protein [Brevibacillus reuszeri]KNB73706.1 hypothetical protein ADS79_07140 [Brevibacillus reuszeri]MED1858483.1 hypothetical protein [Brevibacillus reuszeri]GED69458.1 hypothetical protein BRE01_31600 [Brevibacillus reuszeri]
MRKSTKAWALLFAMCTASLLGGCTYESGTKAFATTNFDTTPEKTTTAQTESGAEWLKNALANAKTDKKAQTYWYKGHVKNMILSRSTTSMFSGAVINGKGYNVDARIAAQPYSYYRVNDKQYIRANDNWVTATDEPLAFDVLAGFDDWLPFMDQAVQLPDEKIIGVFSVPFQLKMTGADWLKTSKSPLFEPLKQQLGDRPDLDYILKQSTIKTTFWFGKDDHLIHQYETWIILPLPGAGTMDQQVHFNMFKYGDTGGINLSEPEDVEKYLLY